MKTATVPLLSQDQCFPDRGKEPFGVLNASEDELARMSEVTLERLRDHVRQATVDCEPAVVTSETQPEEPQVSEAPATETVFSGKSQVETAIEQLVGTVLERSMPSVPLVLLFVGSEPNQHVDEVTTRVAAALCDHAQSRVLLIDSDNVSRNLTAAARQSPGQGVTEVIERNRDWRKTRVVNGVENLDFIPCGNGQFGRWNEKELLRKAVCEMKSEYQFVCVSGGDAHGPAAKLWSDVCDGSYLLVSVKNSNGTVAKSAVTELQSSGARLLGCVVTDVE